jgi:hypothetical protein
MDIFIEKIVTKKKETMDSLIQGLLIFGGIVLAYIVLSLGAVFSKNIGFFLAAGVIYLTYRLVKARNIEFEYAITNGDLDIDKIIAQRKRKRIFSSSCKDFEIVAKLSCDKFNQDVKNIKNQIHAETYNTSPNIYFVVLNYGGIRTVVFFEPDSRMINSFKTYIPKKVFE